MTLTFSLSSLVSFEPVGKVTLVFFDDKSQQVFSVRSGGATGMMCRGFSDRLCSTFRLEDQGPIVTVKLSPDQKVLAVQRSKTDVTFVGVEQTGPNGILDTERPYAQHCKGKSATLLGFTWTSSSEIVFVTDQSVEIYSVLPERRMLKSVRSHAQAIAWYVFCPRTSLIVSSPTVVAAGSLNLFAVKGGYVYKLPRIDIEGAELKEKDVSICNLYAGQCYVAVLLHGSTSATSTAAASASTEIHLYSVSKEQTTVSKSFVLRIPTSGSIALNIVDDLLVVHHQASETSFMFDVHLTGDFDGTSHHLSPVCCGHVKHSADPRMSPSLSHPAAPVSSSSSSSSSLAATTSTTNVYSSSCVFFQPDVVIDANMGSMWKLRLTLDCGQLVRDIPDLLKLVSFLQHRDGAKMVLLDALLERCRDSTATRLHTIGTVFDLLNQQYRLYLDNAMQHNMALPASTFPSPSAAFRSFPQQPAMKPVAKVIVDQSDLYTNIFSVLAEEDAEGESQRPYAILIEYFRSLNQFQIPAQHFLNELLINLLVRRKAWFQLHQMLQYHAISDSKPLACLLLSLESVYRPSYQLAMDMLYRLKNSKEEICEILLSKKKVISALIYAQENGLDHIPSKKFLEAAVDVDDDALYYNVYSSLLQRNLIGSSGFEVFKQRFKQKFNDDDM